MSRRRKKHAFEKLEDINLIPIMNLVVCLIPMVLFGASFIKIGVVNVNAPKFGLANTAQVEENDDKPLNLTVAISEEGFVISASGAIIPGITAPADASADPSAVPPGKGPLIAKKGDDYDFVELYNKLVQVKEQFKDESIVNLTADAKIPFEILIRTMDSIRVRLQSDAFDDLAGFQEAEIKRDDENRAELLWPDVVLAVAQ